MFGGRGGECFFLHSFGRFREKRFLLQLLESRNTFADKVKACFYYNACFTSVSSIEYRSEQYSSNFK